jgi:hypothetical protein
LPFGAGQPVSVIVVVGQMFSEAASLVYYAAPTITSVNSTSCQVCVYVCLVEEADARQSVCLFKCASRLTLTTGVVLLL